MKNDFEGFITKLDMVEERIFWAKDISIESSNTEKQREQRLRGKKNRLSKECRTITKCVTYV